VNFRRSVIIAELWRPEVTRPGNFVSYVLRFFWKWPLTVKFLEFCSKRFHCLTDRCGCVEISWYLSDGKSAKSCVMYLTNKQNFGCLSSCRYCADRAQNLSGPAPNNMLTVLQISSKSVHFRGSYNRTREHRLFAL